MSKPSKDQIRFVLDRAFHEVSAKEEAFVKEQMKKPDPKLDAAEKLLTQAREEVREREEEIKIAQQEITDISEATYNELCKIFEWSPSRDGGYYRDHRGMESSRALLQCWDNSQRTKFREEASKQLKPLYHQFELEVVLSDSKDLAKALDRFTKKLEVKK